MPNLILFNKPFGVLSQFRQDDNNAYDTLASFFVDKSLRVAGRLDATSEGLLFLTDDGRLNRYLTTPTVPNTNPSTGKTYWVQVAGLACDDQIVQLANGVLLKDGKTLPALVHRLCQNDIDCLWQAPPSIAKRAVNSWLSITIFEGKNRQVRRMCASVGLPCLRLVRVASHGFEVHGIGVGEFRQIWVNTQKMRQLAHRQFLG